MNETKDNYIHKHTAPNRKERRKLAKLKRKIKKLYEKRKKKNDK